MTWLFALVLAVSVPACAGKHVAEAPAPLPVALPAAAEPDVAVEQPIEALKPDDAKAPEAALPVAVPKPRKAESKTASASPVKIDAPVAKAAAVASDVADKSATEAEQSVKATNLSLDALTERLKQSSAIGTFTKLAIRSDIIDLKDKIDSYKKKSLLQSKLDDVRASFDGLLMKIIALLSGDPDLSRDLYTARESIWKSLLGGNA